MSSCKTVIGIVGICLSVVATNAVAEPEIGVFFDPGFTQTSIDVAADDTTDIYLVASGFGPEGQTPVLSGWAARLQLPMTAFILTSEFYPSSGSSLVSGNSYSVSGGGCTGAYGGDSGTQILLAHLQVFWFVAPSADLVIQAEPTLSPLPGAPVLGWRDCGNELRFFSGSSAAVANPTGALGGCTSTAVSPAWFDFGAVEVGATALASFCFTNHGAEAVNWNLGFSDPRFSFGVVSDFWLAPGDSASYEVAFTPDSPGPVSAALGTPAVCPLILANGTGVASNCPEGFDSTDRLGSLWLSTSPGGAYRSIVASVGDTITVYVNGEVDYATIGQPNNNWGGMADIVFVQASIEFDEQSLEFLGASSASTSSEQPCDAGRVRLNLGLEERLTGGEGERVLGSFSMRVLGAANSTEISVTSACGGALRNTPVWMRTDGSTALVRSWATGVVVNGTLETGWSAGFSATTTGLSGSAIPVTYFDQQLLSLYGAEDSAFADFDGLTWRKYGDTFWEYPPGYTTDGNVMDCVTFNGQLICGGQWTTIDGLALPGLVARDPGGTWDSFGSPSKSGSNLVEIYDLEVGWGVLYVIGEFDEIGGIQAPAGIAVWDGMTWSAPATSCDRPMKYAVWRAPSLYVAGEFSQVDGVPTRSVARWDGVWHAMDIPMRGQKVTALNAYGGAIYVGGIFYRSDVDAFDQVLRWNGSSWRSVEISAVPMSLVDGTTSMVVMDEYLVVAGTRDWTPMLKLWDGCQSRDLPGYGPDGGLNAPVTLTRMGPHLYAGGPLSQAGGNATSAVARWTGVVAAPVAVGPSITGLGSLRITTSPNPSSSSVQLAVFGLDGLAKVKVFDLRGRLVRDWTIRPVPESPVVTTSWDGRDLNGRLVAAGVYLVRVATGKGVATRKVAVLR